jgi:hypothetical protein
MQQRTDTSGLAAKQAPKLQRLADELSDAEHSDLIPELQPRAPRWVRWPLWASIDGDDCSTPQAKPLWIENAWYNRRLYSRWTLICDHPAFVAYRNALRETTPPLGPFKHLRDVLMVVDIMQDDYAREVMARHAGRESDLCRLLQAKARLEQAADAFYAFCDARRERTKVRRAAALAKRDQDLAAGIVVQRARHEPRIWSE